MLIRLIVLLAAILAGLYMLASSEAVGSLFGFEFRGQEVPLWHAVTAFVMTFLGVIFSLVVQRNGENLAELSWPNFWKAILQYSTPGSIIISVMVYAYAFQILYSSVGDWVAYFSAFQSGFFFNQTVSTVVAGFKTAPKETGAEPTQ